jgi:hypothetical protein
MPSCCFGHYLRASHHSPLLYLSTVLLTLYHTVLVRTRFLSLLALPKPANNSQTNTHSQAMELHRIRNEMGRRTTTETPRSMCGHCGKNRRSANTIPLLLVVVILLTATSSIHNTGTDAFSSRAAVVAPIRQVSVSTGGRIQHSCRARPRSVLFSLDNNSSKTDNNVNGATQPPTPLTSALSPTDVDTPPPADDIQSAQAEVTEVAQAVSVTSVSSVSVVYEGAQPTAPATATAQTTPFVYGNVAFVENESTEIFKKRPQLTEIDVRYNLKSVLHYDPSLERYVPLDDHHDDGHSKLDSSYGSNTSTSQGKKKRRRKVPGRRLVKKIRQRFWPSIMGAYIPEGVTSNYYNFSKWRILQRYISANVHVLTTQSLLMGLGIKSAKGGSRAASLGVSAAVNWVLKDALGKISRMVWASRMGRKFDSDAKRWRFRSSILFATGSGLEVVTYLYPHWFLVLATIANSLKQMSMLTSSATRNAIYNSFRMAENVPPVQERTSRVNVNGGDVLPNGANNNNTSKSKNNNNSPQRKPKTKTGSGDAPLRENIGDITAKGEAQIATVDLLGIGSGVALSKLMGVDSMTRILAVYSCLQICEMYSMYKLTRSVVFNMLNFEKLYGMVESIVDQQQPLREPSSSSLNGSSSAGSRKNTTPSTSSSVMTVEDMEALLPTPSEAAQTEKIFLPPTHLARKAIAFGSIGRAKCSPDELSELLDIFKGERYMIVVGENMKHSNQNKGRSPEERLREHCHVVLHRDATNLDIVRSILALGWLRQELAQRARDDPQNAPNMRSRDCYHLLKDSKQKADQLYPLFVEGLEHNEWSTSRFMFGRVIMRAEWDIVEDDIDDDDEDETSYDGGTTTQTSSYTNGEAATSKTTT